MLYEVITLRHGIPRHEGRDDGVPDGLADLRVVGEEPDVHADVLASLADRLPQRTFLVVTAGPSEAEQWLADLV